MYHYFGPLARFLFKNLTRGDNECIIMDKSWYGLININRMGFFEHGESIRKRSKFFGLEIMEKKRGLFHFTSYLMNKS